MLGRQSIVDVEDYDARSICQAYSVRLMAVDVTDDIPATMKVDQCTYRPSVDRLNGLHCDRAVRTWEGEPFKLSGRQLRFRIEQRTDISRALPAYRTVA